MKNNHWIWMVIGCGLPLLLIFLAPSIGIGGGTWLFTFIIIMFAIHLLMPMQHGSHTHGLSDENLNKKNKKEDEKRDHHH
tara:strand:+ start:1218 stop:1457 length:240 start_codon:yes stop_codon:yes gene_type:complete